MAPSPNLKNPKTITVRCRFCLARLTLQPHTEPIAAHEKMRAHLIHYHVRELGNLASQSGWLMNVIAFISPNRQWRKHAVDVLDRAMLGPMEGRQ